MADKREPKKPEGGSATTGRYVTNLGKKYSKYSDTAEKVRREVDRHMGDKRLSDLLYEGRGKR